MTKELFIGAAACLMLSSAVFAQPANGATAGPLPGPTGAPGATDTSVSGQINATLQAGQIAPSGQSPASDSATVGGASAGQGMRTPRPSTRTYTGPAGATYGPPGATPYTGPAGSTFGSAGGVYTPGARPVPPSTP